jgi:beta-galactosidase
MNKKRFNEGWNIGQRTTILNSTAGDASAFTPVTFPHDAMIGEKRFPDDVNGHYRAYFPGGKYEYTKTFAVPDEYRNKKVVLEFEGVYMNARVFVNGEYAGGRPYGYSGFTVPLNLFLKYGEENTIRVTTENGDDHRWYSGAGIYRNVCLVTGELSRFALSGVRITTEDIRDNYAVIKIENILESENRIPIRASVVTEIFGPDGKPAAGDKTPVTLFPGRSVVRQRIAVKAPRLWNTETPDLYTCKSSLVAEADSTVLDGEENTFGIRILRLNTENGLILNSKTIKLRGACIHHDNGVIGAATFERAEERRAEILKAAGFNAIRSSHNPMSRAMLDACDRLGLLVMDEAFDVWNTAKTSGDYSNYFSEWWERDIEAMVEKDYNHPCVVLYSIGNEIPDTGKPGGAQWGRKLAEKIRTLDSSRYIINSINGMMSAMDEINKMRQTMGGGGGDVNNAMADMGTMMKQIMASDLAAKVTEESYSCVDVGGYNYMDPRYEMDRTMYPNRVICGSETFPPDIAANWELVEKFCHVIGDFTWTGWDYLGEAGIGKIAYDLRDVNKLSGEYPWIAAWCGDIDITGFRRPMSYYREIVWGLRKEPYIAVLKPEHYGKKPIPSPWAWSDSVSSWTWPGYQGKPIQVEVYSDAEKVSLLLNGKEIGRKPVGKEKRFKTLFDTVYQPGKLEVIAYSGGIETGRFTLHTAEDDIELTVTNDREKLILDCGDLAYLTIKLTDKAGVVNMAVKKKVYIKAEGSGVLQGFGNGNPVTEGSYTDAEHTTFEGRALAVIRPTEAGKITVTVESEGCVSKTLAIEVIGKEKRR